MEKRIVEINGVKLEVDLREAQVVDTLKVGDPVKVLVKEYSSFKSHPGVVVGFDNFKERPTIVVMYLEVKYSSCEMKYAYIHKDNEEVEIIKANDKFVPFEKTSVNEMMNEEIKKKQQELDEIKRKQRYFNESFAMYFKDFVDVATEVVE